MASLSKSRTLFAFTSPRTIEKIIPEIKLLIQHFEGQKWDEKNQIKFYELLKESDSFEDIDTEQKNKDGLAGRDRINRAPKALGFVSVDGCISLTDAGKRLISNHRTEEIITRQLMKFQLPSPYHTQTKNRKQYKIKPYLELLRLIKETGGLTKYEIATFFVPMINNKDFDKTKKAIEAFRQCCKDAKGKQNIRVLKTENLKKVVKTVWKDEIKKGKTKTRESNDQSTKAFISTKARILKDYADAFYRYIRATGLVGVKRSTKRITVLESKKEDVEFLLNNVKRNPQSFTNKASFIQYMGEDTNLQLLSDDHQAIRKKLESLGVEYNQKDTLDQLKDKLDSKVEENKLKKQQENEKELQSYSQFDDIIDTFDQIKKGELPDSPLMLEYNACRAMTMLDHAKYVKGNYLTNEECMPISHAGAGQFDIEANYDDFGLIVEVTTATGSKQYEMEGEPVARHYGRAKQTINKNMYCIFIANALNGDTVAHLRMTNIVPSEAYGGKTKIIPMNIDEFKAFIGETRQHKLKNADPLKKFLEKMWVYVQDTNHMESAWRNYIADSIKEWPVLNE